MKATLFISIIFFLCSPVFAQDISGDWEGNIDMNNNPIPIVFHFTKDSSGKITGKWDSPKQNAMRLPFSAINVTEDSLNVEIKMINGFYKGKFINHDSIAGIWSQYNHHIPLNFLRSKENSSTAKSTPVYPNEKEIAITSAAGTKLYGTLLSKNNQQKIAIIVAGSGPTDRNGNSTLAAAMNEYEMLAHSLDSQNIATFRYDKRGIAKSTVANFKESDLVFEDYVKDAEKIFDYLHDTLGFKNIYFIGHSEGSLISMLASEKKNVKGYISIAGAGRPIDVVLNEQLLKMPFSASVKQQIPAILNQLKHGKEVNNFSDSLLFYFDKSIQPYMISWMKYSPEDEIKKLKCPVLIVQGSCDIQVQIVDAKNLHQANKKSNLEIIPNMSHTLKNAGKDCVDEKKTYMDGSMPIDQKLIEEIVNFIGK